ncbi:MAG: general stress protein [Sporichthyaceae bacterium]
MSTQHAVPRSGLDLAYPRSLAVYDDYAQAQRAVDHLSDREFPVGNLLIVGTDLKSVERVTGRLTRGRVAAAGAMSGLWLGLLVGLVVSIFDDGNGDGGQAAAALLVTPLLGALFGLVWSQIGFAALTRGGTRDFASVSQVVATRYEVLVEHSHAERARELLAALPDRAGGTERG